MAFRRFQPPSQYVRPGIPGIALYGARGQLWINPEALRTYDALAKMRYVNLWYDDKAHRAGIEIVQIPDETSRLVTHRGGAAVVSCTALVRQLGVPKNGKHRAPLHYDANEDLYVFDGRDKEDTA